MGTATEYTKAGVDGLNALNQPDLPVAATVTSSATLVANYLTPVDATSGNKTMTLPTPVATNQQIIVEKIDTSSNTVTVTGTIRGATTNISLALLNETVVLEAESLTSWRPTSGHKTLTSLDARYAPITAKSMFINVLNYGADNTAATSSDAAIAAALSDLPIGGVLFFPAGKYRVVNTINIPPGVTLKGAMGHRYQKYNAGSNATYIKPLSGSFTGTALVTATDSWGWRIEDINLDGFGVTNTSSGNVHGILIQGASKGFRLVRMSIKSFTGDGVRTEALSSGYPNGAEIHQIFIDGCNGNGWYSTDTAYARNYVFGDSSFNECESSVNGLDGWRFDGVNNFSMVQCKSEFNSGNGYHIVGSALRTSFTACSTDRNYQNGFWIDSPEQSGSAAGNQVLFIGCEPSRDGPTNITGSTGPAATPPYSGGYAGFRFETSDGTSTSVRAIITGCAVRVGRNDAGDGVMSPDYGIYVARGRRILVSASFIYATYQATYDPLLAIRDDFSTYYTLVDPSSYSLTQDVGTNSIKSIWGGSTLRITDGTAPPSNTLSAKVHIQRTTDNVALGLINTNAGNAKALLAMQAATVGSVVTATTLPSDTFSRFAVRADGTHEWGSGGVAADVVLQRASAGVLNVSTGALQVAGANVRGDTGFKGLIAAAPTTGTAAVGDWYRNSAPTVGGVFAWICTTAGTPGTWRTVALS